MSTRQKRLFLIFTFWAGIVGSEPIHLIVRADDIGSFHAANIACIESFRRGVVRTVEVMVPCPWFNEAAELLRRNPGLDVGVHLTLTSEWEYVKWRPITPVTSFVDAMGNFLPLNRQAEGYPQGSGFLQSGYDLTEVENELRAQIEIALKEIPQVSHLTAHMGTATCMPDLKAVVTKLANEYELPLELPLDPRRFRPWTKPSTAEEKIDAMVKGLQQLEPGLSLFVEHPAKNWPEMAMVGHLRSWDTALDRDGVTAAFTDKRVLEVVQERGIQLLSYKQALEKYDKTLPVEP